MCGIAGILNLDGRPCDVNHVRRFTDAVAHRGPDGRGVFTDGPLGLGHRRLAILDLSEMGHQPMSCLDGRYWITYNGEIYNFLELRRKLAKAGIPFRTESDTEVIAAAYHHWGPQCTLQFNGMWALAIWSTERRELFLSRDRFGIKPLHYVVQPGRFAFASELKAFCHLDGFVPRENAAEMRKFLARGGASMEDTLFEGVKRLPGGYNMVVSAEGMRTWRWWQTLDHLPSVPKRLPEQAEKFRELFFDSVRLRLRSDVSVGTALSGGLDSSSIVCSIPRVGSGSGEREARDCHHAFVATFPGTLWDERAYAASAIERAGATPHFIPIEIDDVLEGLQQYTTDLEMVGERLSIPLWLTYRAQRRQNIVVSIDGHGADEMLAGYHRTLLRMLQGHGNLLRAPVRTVQLTQVVRGLHETGGLWAGQPPSMARLIREYDPFLRGADRVLQRGRRFARRMLSGGARSSEAVHGRWAPDSPPITNADEETLERMRHLSPLKKLLYREFHVSTLPNVLRTFDRCSMAHGVELRMPFLDWRLVTYVFALPETSIAGGGFTKRVLREAMRDVIPEDIRKRRGKIGFSSPMPDWFNGRLGDVVWNEVNTQSFLGSDVWDGPLIRDFVASRHRARNWTLNDANRVWRFVGAHMWRSAVFA